VLFDRLFIYNLFKSKFKFMNLNQYLKLVKSRYQILVGIIGGILIITLVLTLVQTFKYRSTIQLLVIQKQGASIDAYTALRSAEKMASNLASVVYTSSFLDRVTQTNSTLKDDLSIDPIERKKEWQRTVNAEVVPETGILKIEVYHHNRNQAIAYAQAISSVLVNQGSEYHGGGQEVGIKNIDAPLTSRYPVQPNIVINLGIALALGAVLSLAVIYLLGEEKNKTVATTRLNSDLAAALNKTLVNARPQSQSVLAQETIDDEAVIPVRFSNDGEVAKTKISIENILNSAEPQLVPVRVAAEPVASVMESDLTDDKIETMYDHWAYPVSTEEDSRGIEV